MPFFPWVALTFFSLSRFVIEFLLFSTVWDLFGPLWEWSLIICYFGLILPFLGSNTHFSWVTPTFLPPNSFLTWFFIFSRKKKDVVGQVVASWPQKPRYDWVWQWERALQTLTGSLLLPWRQKKMIQKINDYDYDLLWDDSKPLQMIHNGAKLCSTLVPKR